MKTREINITQEEVVEMYEDYQKGMTLETLSEEYGFAVPTIRKRFAKYGLPVRSSAAKITIEDMPRIIELRAQGKTYDEISKIYGCDACTVGNAYKRFGMEDEWKTATVEKQQAERTAKRHKETFEMYELYKQGMSKAEAARKFGYTGTAACRRFKEMNLPNIERQRYSSLSDDDVRKAYDEYMHGATIEELTQRYHYTADTFYKRFRRLNLKTRGGRSEKAFHGR